MSAKATAQRLNSTEVSKLILTAFDGSFRRVRISIWYRFAVIFAACCIILLPLAYVALTALIGCLWYYHATSHVSIMWSIHPIQLGVFVYIGSVTAGLILFVFMFKPLFAKRIKPAATYELQLSQEPLLFAFVDRLRRAVGAPAPRSICLDCRANASAELRGGLLNLLRRDLVLNIGLSLVGGLTLRQFAGVLAHEMAHLSQGAGTRFNFLISRVNAWFVSAVYERDSWDEALDEWCDEADRFSIIFYLAKFFVWVTRGVLWVLMILGYAITFFLSRQMEYHADRFEMQIAGSKAFEANQKRLYVLSVAEEEATAVLMRQWQEGRLISNVPQLILSMADQLPASALTRIEQMIAEERTGLWDTHPASKDRILAARAFGAAGIFQVDFPATILFRDFSKRCEAVTLHFYRQISGRRITRDHLSAANR